MLRRWLLVRVSLGWRLLCGLVWVRVIVWWSCVFVMWGSCEVVLLQRWLVDSSGLRRWLGAVVRWRRRL